MDRESAITEQRKECCSQCPFARHTSKAYLDTRGDNSERFIGQAHINALLPCHMESDDGNATVGEGRQCAGAAKFRANCNVQGIAPAIGKLPQDSESVFDNEQELLAHHKGVDFDPDSPSPAEIREMAKTEFHLALSKGRYY